MAVGLIGVGALMVWIFSTRDELVDSLPANPSHSNSTTSSSSSGSGSDSEEDQGVNVQSNTLDLADVFEYANRKELWLALALPSCLYGLMIPVCRELS